MGTRLPSGMFVWIAGGVFLSIAGAYLAARIGAAGHHHGGTHDSGHHHAAGSSSPELHAWMHERLEISDEQWAQLEPFEKAFETDRERLQKEIAEGGQSLAAAISKGEREAPEIKEAAERINRAQAELQEITLDHFFVMKEHLDPDQAKRLLEWTHDSITRQHRN